MGDAGTITPVEASFDVRLADYIRVQAWHVSRSWSWRVLYVGWLAIAGVLIALRGPSVLLEPALLAGTSALLLGIPIMTVWGIWWGLRALKPARLRKTYTIGPSQLVMADSLAETRLSWEAIQRAVETSHAFHMFPQKRFAYFVPKRAFQCNRDIEVVRTILRDALGSRAALHD